MADTQALADVTNEQTAAAIGDLFFVEKAGVPGKIAYSALMDNSYTYSSTLTLGAASVVNFSAGTVTFSSGQIVGASVAAATRTSRGTIELATPTEAEDGSDDARAVTPLGVNSVISKYNVGIGQEWSQPTRAVSTSYENTQTRPIQVAISLSGATGLTDIQAKKPGGSWVTIGRSGGAAAGTCSFVVPPGHFYRVNGAATVDIWAECR